ncbi:FGGY family carbohydrate kinase [Paenibacillus sp. JTLBN-2024]
MSNNMMIGIDIGTTSTKAVIFEENGKVVAKGSEGYPLHTPTSSIAEQDPDLIFAAVIHSVKQAMEKAGQPRTDHVRVLQLGDAQRDPRRRGRQAADEPHVRGRTTAARNGREKLKKDMNGHEFICARVRPFIPCRRCRS